MTPPDLRPPSLATTPTGPDCRVDQPANGQIAAWHDRPRRPGNRSGRSGPRAEESWASRPAPGGRSGLVPLDHPPPKPTGGHASSWADRPTRVADVKQSGSKSDRAPARSCRLTETARCCEPRRVGGAAAVAPREGRGLVPGAASPTDPTTTS